MHSTLVSSALVLAAAAGLVSAAAPPAFARANLVPGPLGPLSGSVLFTASGEGVIVSLEVSNFPETGGPWPYHVHEFPITNNNCSTAGPPYFLPNQSSIPVPCPQAIAPDGCACGDMAGQFGNLTAAPGVTTMAVDYYDPYISLDPNNERYVGNLSFNVHWANFTVIACANIIMDEAAPSSVSSASSASASSSASAVTSGTTTVSQTVVATSTTASVASTSATSSPTVTSTSDANARTVSGVLSIALLSVISFFLL